MPPPQYFLYLRIFFFATELEMGKCKIEIFCETGFWVILMGKKFKKKLRKDKSSSSFQLNSFVN